MKRTKMSVKPVTGVKKHRGDMLISLMIGIAIMAILAGAYIFGLSPMMDKANVSKATTDLSSYDYAIQTMMLENPGVVSGALDYDGETKATEEAIVALMGDCFATDLQVEDSTITWTADGGKILGTDPWGNHYMMHIDFSDGGQSSGFTTECFVYIYTYGGDNALNGADDCYLVVQYSDGAVFSDIRTNTNWDATAVAFEKPTT